MERHRGPQAITGPEIQTTQASPLPVAVLVDAENVSPRYAELVFSEVARGGLHATCRRAYANWASPLVAG